MAGDLGGRPRAMRAALVSTVAALTVATAARAVKMMVNFIVIYVTTAVGCCVQRICNGGALQTGE